MVIFMDLEYWNDGTNSGKLVFGGRGWEENDHLLV